MLKAVRNTVFTISALALTATGLAWNKDIAASHLPLNSQAAVLAAANVTSGKLAFPLKLSFSSPAVRLGQYQVLTITTVPEASLDIITTYPDGSTRNAQTLKAVADQTGRYQLRFKLGDWHSLGLFTVRVMAQTGGQTAQLSSRFVLQTTDNSSGTAATEGSYVYPLVP